eukprot:7276073-Ditylum_brightwellii.AAC.1
MVTNPLDIEEGSQVISESGRENEPGSKEVKLVFKEGVEGEEFDTSLGFNIGANVPITIEGIEVPEPGFAPTDLIRIREKGVEETKRETVFTPPLTSRMTSHAEFLLGGDRRATTAPRTAADIHKIKAVVKKWNQTGLEQKDLRKLRELSEAPLSTKFD